MYTTVRRSEIAAYLWAMPLQTLRWLTVRNVRRLQTTVLRFHVGGYLTLNATVLGIWLLAGQGTFWPALVLLPSTALLAWHAVLSRRLTRALGRRGW